MMHLISSEILKKEITALPKQMAALMNTTAESHSEIPLTRNTTNTQFPFSTLYLLFWGELIFTCLKVLETKLQI